MGHGTDGWIAALFYVPPLPMQGHNHISCKFVYGTHTHTQPFYGPLGFCPGLLG